MNWKKIISGAILCSFCWACNSWLDVKPIDKVLEDQLFQSETGFEEALNGIYIELNQSSLYGGDLMFNMVEVLAQRYDVSDVATNKNVII